MKKKNKLDLFDILNYFLLAILMFIILYPMYYTVIASFSDPKEVASGNVTWKIVGFSLDAYRHVFQNKQIWVGYGNTIFYTVFGTMFNIALTIPAAYVLSKTYLPCKKLMMGFFLFTMYFSGGMIPAYFLVKNLGLINTRACLVLLGGISIYNLIVTKSFFMSSIPESLYEAAEIDGAGEVKKFFAIALPLSKSILAVMVLYYAVTHWNSYFNALLYISDRKLEPLQQVLRRILLLNENALNVDTSQLSMDELLEVGVNEFWPLVARGGQDRLYFQNAFGWVSTSQDEGTAPCLDAQTGSVVVPCLTEKYTEYIKLYHTLYKEGLLHPDYFTMDNAAARALYAEGKAAVDTDSAPYLFDGEGFANYVLAEPLTSDWSATEPIVTSNLGYIKNFAFISADTEYPEVCMRLLDWYYSEEGMVYSGFGAPKGSEDTLDMIAASIMMKNRRL